MNILATNKLNLSIGGKVICRDLSLQVNEYDRWAVLGPNGVGKTTLLHSILGLYAADSGQILIESKPMQELSRRELALKIGILFQQAINMVPATVMETVMLGRHPHVQSIIQDTPEDIAIAKQMLEALELNQSAERQMDSLSGGESQRVALAMLLAQAPRLLLLDEPSNHLDLAFQMKMMSILSDAITKGQSGMLMATHDINLAARFCNKVLLLMGNGETLQGDIGDVLTADCLSQAYGCQIHTLSSDEVTLFYPAY